MAPHLISILFQQDTPRLFRPRIGLIGALEYPRGFLRSFAGKGVSIWNTHPHSRLSQGLR